MLFESSSQDFGMQQTLDESNKVQSEICDAQFPDVLVSTTTPSDYENSKLILTRGCTPPTEAAVPVSTPRDGSSSGKVARLPFYAETNVTLRAEFS